MKVFGRSAILQKRLNDIVLAHKGYIEGLPDIAADQKPSILFYLLGKKYAKLLSGEQSPDAISRGIKMRRKLHHALIKVLPYSMSKRQEIEFDADFIIPDRPVIWIANHGFKDDIAATLVAAKRHTYILFGSLPAFYNTFDGVAAYINGVILVNRKVKRSGHESIERAINILKNGADLLIFPEGVWNKTPDRLILELWPGVYRIAVAAGGQIVPVTHYLRDPDLTYKSNIIHTKVSKPISMSGLSESEGVELLRDVLASNYYSLMESYGQSTREELLNNYDSADAAWEAYLQKHTEAIKYYDKEIELRADYRSSKTVRPEQVWELVARIKDVNLQNIQHILFAQHIYSDCVKRDFQRKY